LFIQVQKKEYDVEPNRKIPGPANPEAPVAASPAAAHRDGFHGRQGEAVKEEHADLGRPVTLAVCLPLAHPADYLAIACVFKIANPGRAEVRKSGRERSSLHSALPNFLTS